MVVKQQDNLYFGTGRAIERVRLSICAAAEADCAVLIRGETGSGKGVAARRIHDLSGRKEMPFVDINCTGLQGELLKSELFGHAKGSFTGAVADRPGLIEEAGGGTLFLDEIGDMDLNVQCLLLKAIEEKTYRRIGENGKRKSNFRLICATNRDLPKAMKEGAFRQDLFYRINTFPIMLPPLRERKEDIAGLMALILHEMHYKHPPLGYDVIDTLTRHPWPGNIRELRNAAERALVFAKDQPLTAEHFANLGDDGMAETISAQLIEVQERPSPAETETAPTGTAWNLQDLETLQILKAIKHFDGDKTQACNALGISPSSLYRRLDKILAGMPLEEWLEKWEDENDLKNRD